MKWLCGCLLIITMMGAGAQAQDHSGHHAAMGNDPSVVMTFQPGKPLKAGETSQVTLMLSERGSAKPVTEAMLKRVHTQKLHLLIVDPTLSDYHHVHPTPSGRLGAYVFDFTPKKNGLYRVWADITPTATNKQEYVVADLGRAAELAGTIDKKQALTATAQGYEFKLSFDTPPTAGKSTAARITVSKDGAPFTQLEPVMGAYAHLVGFSEDYNSVLHIHPGGKEPTNEDDRGGPELSFHLTSETPGFVKLYVQIRVNKQDIYAPFGMEVKPAAGLNTAN